MNNAELVSKVQESLGSTAADAKKAVEAVFEAIAAAAQAGEEVTVANFGKFKVKDVPARTGRNPSTGAEIQIAASRKVSFAAGKALKDRL